MWSSCILAVGKSDVFGTSRITLAVTPLLAVRINHFFLHSVTINGASLEHFRFYIILILNLKANHRCVVS